MRKFSIILFFLGITYSCSAPKFISGSYYSILPCADCGGIHYALQLTDGGKFTERFRYAGKSDSVHVKSGEYTRRGKRIILNEETNAIRQQFILTDTALLQLNLQGEWEKGPLSEMYVLKPTPPENFNLAPVEHYFTANGTAPENWHLALDSDGNMYFTMQGITIVAAIPEGEHPQDINALSLKTDMLQAMLYPEYCTDAFSKEHNYKVRVSVKDNAADEWQSYIGCGDYKGDYQMNGQWWIAEVNGQPIPAKKAFLELSLLEGRVSGYSSCNRFFGKATITDGKLILGQLASTRKMCAEMKIEQLVLSALTPAAYTYNYTAGARESLQLSSEEATLKLIRR